MSRLRASARPYFAAAAATAAAALTAAAPATAASTATTAECTFPKIGKQTIALQIDYPEGLMGGDSVPSATLAKFDVPAAVLGLGAIVSLERGTNLTYEVQPPSSAPYISNVFPESKLPLQPEYTSGISTYGAGDYTTTLKSLRLSVRAVTASGTPALPEASTEGSGDPATFAVPCTLAPTAPAKYSVGPATPDYDRIPPSAPTELKAASASPTSAKISWKASTDDGTVDRYAVWAVRTSDTSDPPEVIGYSTRGTEAVISHLAPGTEYLVRVQAWDRGPNRSEVASVTVRTPALATAPKLSNYSVRGRFTIAVTPKAEDGRRFACVIEQPTVALAGSGLGDKGARVSFQALWTGKWGLPTSFTPGRRAAASVRDGGNLIDLPVAIGLSPATKTASRSGLAKSGRVTLIGTSSLPRKVGGRTVNVPVLLPVKSVPYAFVDKGGEVCGNTSHFFWLTA